MIHRHSMDRKFDQRKKRNKISKKHQGGQDPPLTYSPRSWRREREEYRKFVLHQSVIRQFIYFDPGVNPCGGFGGECQADCRMSDLRRVIRPVIARLCSVDTKL